MISRKLYRGATVLAAGGVLRLGMKPVSRSLTCALRVLVPRTAFKLSLRIDLARFLTDQTSTLGLLTVRRLGIHDQNVEPAEIGAPEEEKASTCFSRPVQEPLCLEDIDSCILSQGQLEPCSHVQKRRPHCEHIFLLRGSVIWKVLIQISPEHYPGSSRPLWPGVILDQFPLVISVIFSIPSSP